MKIAIPTNDGFTINQDMKKARGFLVSTIQSGEVVNQEMRWNPDWESIKLEDIDYQNLIDCEKVIVGETGFDQGSYLQINKTEVLHTDETMITNVLMEYLNTSLLEEANTCCCP
jgi:predicted Fe-Mo cluster-binding NifX family protein